MVLQFDLNESNNEYIEPSNEIPQLSDTLSYIEMSTPLSNTELLQAITGLATSVNALVAFCLYPGFNRCIANIVHNIKVF